MDNGVARAGILGIGGSGLSVDIIQTTVSCINIPYILEINS